MIKPSQNNPPRIARWLITHLYLYNDRHSMIEDFEDTYQEISKNPYITHVSSMSELPVDIWKRRSGLDWEGKPADMNPDMAELKVDLDFIETFQIQIIKGRSFSKRIFDYLTYISILIAGLGLYGLTMLIIGQKTKEIGVRKVYGASIANIIRLLSADFIRWVIISNVFALPFAYYFMNKWLDNFAYRIEFGVVTILTALTLSVFIALSVIIYQTVKAARTNPINSLRCE